MHDLGVPFMDMQARLRPIRKELLAACERVIDSGVFVMGPEAAALEDDFARFCGVEHALAVSNGTAALQLALLATGVGPGDEVITAANTFIATAEAISAVGATPVLVDAKPDTYLIDPGLIEAAITPRTKAIIPVHLYGLMCDMVAISDIARRHGLLLIEDACQAHGATYRGKRAGSFGEIGCFSFYPGKNMGTIGEGGAAVTNDAAIAARMRTLRSHGEVKRYQHVEPGWNLRLSEMLAAAARIQLSRLPRWNEDRRRVAAQYAVALRGLPLQLPVVAPDQEHVFHLYVVQVDDRDAVRAALDHMGIGTGIHYPLPVHEQEAYASLGLRPGSMPVAEGAARRILSLPMFPEMTGKQVDLVAAALRSATRAQTSATTPQTSATTAEAVASRA